MNRHCGQEWWSIARFTIRAGTFCLVELRGLEPLTPCLQIAVTDQPAGVELDLGLPVSDRRVPLAPGPNGTVMAHQLGSFLLCHPAQHLVPAISR
jgi:hypothetical protein